MKLATTTADLGAYIPGNGQDLEKTKETLRTFTLTGFKYLDYSFYRDLTKEYLLMQDDWQDTFKEIREYADEIGLSFVQAHSAGGNPIRKDEHYDALLESTIRSIKACQILGIKNTVVHSGHILDMTKEEIFSENKAFYEKLFPIMEETGVSVLAENSARGNFRGNYYIFNTGESLAEFVDYVNHPLFAACWDTGHGNMEEFSQYKSITDLGDRLKAVHIADNLGIQDNHFAPYFGSLNMDEIINALLDIDFKGPFTFEGNSLMIQGEVWPVPRKKWEKDTRLYEVPLELKIEAEKLLYKIGKYILEKYECFEE